LSDHLSCQIARIPSSSSAQAARMFGPRFLRGRMRSTRLVARPGSGGPRAFFHFVFAHEQPGFVLMRNLLAGLQARHLPSVSASELLAAVGGVGALAWHRIVHNRLYVAPQTECSVQMDMEQHRSESNCIVLGDRKDRHERFIPIIRWSASEEDLTAMERLASTFVRKWRALPVGFPAIEPVRVEVSGLKPHDAFHPVGTCSMGDEGSSVVARDLRVHGSVNLYVLSTAVFPTAGTANPTFSMLCLGEALAEKISAQVKYRPPGELRH